MPAGRPTKYDPAYCDRVITLGSQGMSDVEIAVELGVARSNLHSWAQAHPEFSASLTLARQASQAWWERKIRAGKVGNMPGQLNPAITKHVLSCRFRDDYRERLETETTARVTYEVVTGVDRTPDDPQGGDDGG